MQQERADDIGPAAPVNMRTARIGWFAALVVCPLAMAVVGFSFERPRGIYWDRPLPARVIDVLFFLHVGASIVAAIAAFWVWGRRWWLAWVGILIAGGIACTVAVGAWSSVIGYNL